MMMYLNYLNTIYMPNTIAEYYNEELLDWNNSIILNLKDQDELEKKLGEVIRRNSIVGIADKVAERQNILNELSDKFYRLQIELEQQEAALKTNDEFVDNSLINQGIENLQNELRHKMQAAEKEYVDAKYECYKFLSGTLKK